MFRRLSEFIPRAVNKMGLSQQTTAAHVCQAFRKIAPIEIHPDALLYIYPRYFRHGSLMIGVADSAWAQLVTGKKTPLLRALSLRLHASIVKNIRTSICENPSVRAEESFFN